MNISRLFNKIDVVGFLVIATLVVTLASAPAWAANGRSSSDGVLSPIEASDLTFMREEEKLARDVYLVMYDQWGATIFDNIAASEQKHMDTMLSKLVKYNLPDPAAKTAIGEFTDPDLQQLYDDLIALGSESLKQALAVGVIIENKDMVDIQEAIDHSTHADIVKAYQNLMAGSENHLRAFLDVLVAP